MQKGSVGWYKKQVTEGQCQFTDGILLLTLLPNLLFYYQIIPKSTFHWCIVRVWDTPVGESCGNGANALWVNATPMGQADPCALLSSIRPLRGTDTRLQMKGEIYL